MANLIRLKQLDLAELSGYISGFSLISDGNNGVINPGNYYLSSGYNFFTGNFNVSGYSLSIAKSSYEITGVLPNLSNNLICNIKNIGAGLLVLTGSANIDESSVIGLQKNESIEILGVNNIYYSGWITITSNAGI
jgi:hypothetical protein